MGFVEIPMNTTGAWDSQSMSQRIANQRIRGAISGGFSALSQQMTAQRNAAAQNPAPAPQPVQPQQQWNQPAQQPVQRQTPPPVQRQTPPPVQPQQQQWNQPAQQPVQRQAPPPVQPPAPAPVQRTNPKPYPEQAGGAAKLMRGQKAALKCGGTPVNSLKIRLSWQVKDARCELDASSFMLGGNEKVPGDEWFVFYGQPQSPDASVRYEGWDAKDGGEVDISLARVSAQIEKITVAVTIYEAMAQHLNFSMVGQVRAELIDTAQNKMFASLDLTDGSPAVTALVVGEIYRYKGEWKFNAVGSGVQRDLAAFCGMYGVELE